jgi:hypothetical protein
MDSKAMKMPLSLWICGLELRSSSTIAKCLALSPLCYGVADNHTFLNPVRKRSMMVLLTCGRSGPLRSFPARGGCGAKPDGKLAKPLLGLMVGFLLNRSAAKK